VGGAACDGRRPPHTRHARDDIDVERSEPERTVARSRRGYRVGGQRDPVRPSGVDDPSHQGGMHVNADELHNDPGIFQKCKGGSGLAGCIGCIPLKTWVPKDLLSGADSSAGARTGPGEGQRDHSVRYASPKKAPTASATPVGWT
jgi:hypothetical protein